MNAELLQRIEDLLGNYVELNLWEIDFLESLERQVKSGGNPSASQLEKLAEIELGRD